MVVKEIKPQWWMLVSDDGVRRLIFFGHSQKIVIGKFRSWLREMDLEKVRVRHGM